MTRSSWALVAAGFALSACGGGKPAATPPTPERAPLVMAHPPPLTKVAPPPELIAVGRIKNPGSLADTVAAWSGVRLDWRKLLAREAPEFERVFVSGAPVDFAAILDPASTLEPRALYAFSFGVSSADAVAAFFRKQGATVAEIEGSAFRARLGDSLLCIAGPALGAAPARVACSDEADGTDALAPYLLRGMPTESIGASEVHAHLLAEPLRRRYRAQIPAIKALGVPFVMHEIALNDDKFDHVLAGTLKSVADELIAIARDVNRLDLDIAVSGSDAELSLELAFSGSESFTSRAVTRMKAEQVTPPEVFWNLPADTTMASFVRSSPEIVKPVAQGISELADAWLEHFGLEAPRRAALVDALEAFLEASPRGVFASIPGPDSRAEVPATLFELAVGEKIWVVDGGGDRVIPLASAAVKAFSDKKFRAALAQGRVFSAEEQPVFRERGPRGIKGAPKGARVFEAEFPIRKPVGPVASSPARKGAGRAPLQVAAAPEVPFRALLVAVPDGARCWLALGAEEKALFERIRSAREAGSSTLAQREGLRPLHDIPMVAGGFTSISSVLGRFTRALRAHGGLRGRLPHGGGSPILWDLTVREEGPAARLQGHFPRAAIEDIASLLGNLLQ